MALSRQTTLKTRESLDEVTTGDYSQNKKILAMSEYIYSAISNRRICAAYAHFGSQSHLDRHEAKIFQNSFQDDAKLF